MVDTHRGPALGSLPAFKSFNILLISATVKSSCKTYKLGENCIQNFHLERYIIKYMVGNLVLQRRESGVIKLDWRYIGRYTVVNLVLRRRESGVIKRDFQLYIQKYKNFEYGYPYSYALVQFPLNLKPCKPHKATHHHTKCDVINVVKQFLTVYSKIYCHKFLTLSNQTWRCKIQCIRIHFHQLFACRVIFFMIFVAYRLFQK